MTEDELGRALELARIKGRYENWSGSGVLTSPYGSHNGREADFVDHGLAFAVAEILNAVNDGRLVRTGTDDRLNDLRRLLRALDLGDHARPSSPAEVFDLCLAEIASLRASASPEHAPTPT